MEHEKYEALVEEILTLKRRARRDQARLMVLIKEAEDGGVLDRLCYDVNLSMPAAKNYLAAHAKFLDLGIVPERDTSDGLIAEMWEDVFDPTLHDTRYASVDREGVDAAADELGLRGNTKAYDIAKNPQSMKAAIIGDGRAASAAIEAIIARAKTDPLIATALRTAAYTPSNRNDHALELSDTEIVQDLLHRLDRTSIRLGDVDVPDSMADLVARHVETVIGRLYNIATIMKGKGVLVDL